MALASPSLMARARAIGVSIRSRGTRTGPILAEHLEQLGLRGLGEELSRLAGRDVNLMIYDSLKPQCLALQAFVSGGSLKSKKCLIGIRDGDLDEVRLSLEKALGSSLEARESLYLGGDYYLFREDGLELSLRRNHDCLEDDLEEPDFPDSAQLLYVHGDTQRVEKTRNLVLEVVAASVKLQEEDY